MFDGQRGIARSTELYAPRLILQRPVENFPSRRNSKNLNQGFFAGIPKISVGRVRVVDIWGYACACMLAKATFFLQHFVAMTGMARAGEQRELHYSRFGTMEQRFMNMAKYLLSLSASER